MIQIMEARAENIGTRGGKMHEAMTLGKKEPASVRESLRSDVVRARES